MCSARAYREMATIGVYTRNTEEAQVVAKIYDLLGEKKERKTIAAMVRDDK